MAQGERTEKATPRRLAKARQEGNFAVSAVFVSAVQFAVAVAWLTDSGEEALAASRAFLRESIALAFRGPGGSDLVAWAQRLGWRIAAAALGAATALVLVTVGAQLLATRLGVSGARLRPQFSRLNGFARLPGLLRQNWTSFLQAALLLLLAAAIAAWRVEAEWSVYLKLLFVRAEAGIRQAGASAGELLRYGSYVFLMVGCLDLFRQWRRYDEQLRMTKQEVREEAKQQEGNPETKARIRRLQRDLGRRRMMAQVPRATAVVVNPTHFAVALRYRIGEPGAPRVVAKGRNHLAQRIRALAVRSGVPIVENAPLARALYQQTAVGQEIPPQLYRAVAEILAYIMRLLEGRPRG